MPRFEYDTAVCQATGRSWMPPSRRGLLASAAAAGAIPEATDAQPVPGPAMQPGLRVLSAGSTLYGMRPAAIEFTRSAGVPVTVATEHGHNVEKFALAGSADADVVVIPTAMMAKLIAAGRADKNSLVEIGAVRIGAAVHERARKPDVSRMDALRSELLGAKEVLLTSAPTGEHLSRVIAQLSIASDVTPKIKRFNTATLLNKYIAEHPEAGALGFGPTTEILTWRDQGVVMAGAVPDAIQIVLPYQAGMLTRSQSAENARKLLAFLATPSARKHFHDSGVE